MDGVIARVLWDAYRLHQHQLYDTQAKLSGARNEVANLERLVEDHQTCLAEIASHADVNGIDIVAEYERRYGVGQTTPKVAFQQ